MAALTAPRHLGATGRKLWRETTSKYELRQDELETLKAACGSASELAGVDDSLHSLIDH